MAHHLISIELANIYFMCNDNNAKYSVLKQLKEIPINNLLKYDNQLIRSFPMITVSYHSLRCMLEMLQEFECLLTNRLIVITMYDV